MLAPDERLFSQWLRHAMKHLYDPSEVRRSPLIELFGLDRRSGAAQLRSILVQAVQALQPDATVSPQTDTWRSYEILHRCYVQQFTQDEAATSLGMSTRQLQRHDTRALLALAEYLIIQHGLKLLPAEQAVQENTEKRPYARELDWAAQSFESDRVSVTSLLDGLRPVAARLCQSIHADMVFQMPETALEVDVQLATVRQALLGVLTSSIRMAAHGEVRVSAALDGDMVCILITSRGRTVMTMDRDPKVDPWNADLTRQLLALSGGTLEIHPASDESGAHQVTVRLPSREVLGVLVIDDNVDTLRLFQRYLAGTRFTFSSARDPQEGLAAAARLHPAAIVVDVMLPGMDGWELLGRLREHPATQDVPIIVCTILPQEQLALTLGASAFLAKPAGQEDLMKVLDQVLETAQG